MRQLLIQVFLTLLSILFFVQLGYSSHLVGGDATYSFVRFNNDTTRVTFEVTFSLYKDSNNGAPLAAVEDFGVFEEISPGVWESVRVEVAGSNGLLDIPAIDEPCREEPPASQIGVETRQYIFEVTLDISDNNYQIVYMRCCRNTTIFNMAATNEGSIFDLIITPEAQRLGNSSPSFDEFPPIFICAGFPLDVSQKCTDPEGDEIRYSFCTPLAIGGPRTNGAASTSCDLGANPDERMCTPPYEMLTYETPFTEDRPMAGNPIVRISPNTGLITGVPETTGQYLVGICVEEYRNGVLLSRLRRDFQFNALTCVKELSANLEADEVLIDNSTGISRPINVIKACGDSLVNFQGFDVNNTIINYSWNVQGPNGETLIDTSGRSVRNLDVFFPELGEYRGILAVEDSEGCTDTAFLNVVRLPDLETEFEFELLDTCYLAPIQYSDLSVAEASQVVEWNWDFGSEASSTEQNPIYEFETRGVKRVSLVTMDLNTCIDTFVQVIDYNPPLDSLLITEPEVNICFGDSLLYFGTWLTEGGVFEETVVSESSGCDSLYSALTLNIGDEPRSTMLDTVLCPGEFVDYFGVIYNEQQLSSGENDFMHVTSSATSDCDSILHFIRYEYEELPIITVDESNLILIANKDQDLPVTISGIFEETLWTPPTGLDCTDCPVPEVNSEIDTTYSLQVFTDDDCLVEDSLRINFVVVPERYYFASSVSNNSSNDDDKFFFLQTQTNAFETVTYDMQVFDRWGGLLFTGTDLNINDRTQGWSIRSTLPGSYVYKVEVHEFFETRQFSGTVTVLK